MSSLGIGVTNSFRLFDMSQYEYVEMTVSCNYWCVLSCLFQLTNMSPPAAEAKFVSESTGKISETLVSAKINRSVSSNYSSVSDTRLSTCMWRYTKLFA